MLLTSARVVPHSMRARFVSFLGLTTTLPSSSVAAISLSTASASVPSRPLAVTVDPASSTVTPCGRVTGFLPMRDMALPQKTRHRTSPPTLAVRASLSDMTPRGVDRMAMPSPL